MLPVLSWRNFSGEFPHPAKAEPSSSNMCSKALCCSKIASSAGSLRSVEVNDIDFWVVREEKPDHRVLKTPGTDWGQKPHHKLCLRLVLSITEPRALWFCCLICSEFPHRSPLSTGCHPLEPSANFGETQKDFWLQENGLNLGSCALSAFFTTQRENSAGCAGLKVFLLLCLGSSAAKHSCLGQEIHLNSPGKCYLSNNSF